MTRLKVAHASHARISCNDHTCVMNGLVFYIGLGLGLAAACGMRPFLPLLLAGALATSGALGVSFSRGAFTFLEADWWLLAVTVALALSYALQVLLSLAPTIDQGERSTRPDPLAASLAGVGVAGGALLFAGTLAAHGDASWPGIIGGFLAAGLAQRASGPTIARARKRLPDRGAREALTVYLDSASLLLAALVALLHPLGYVAVALLAWYVWRMRARSEEKYAGLRILRR
ncbi:MAG: DUF4126 family protein [Solirubrobacteraceae bacterium]